MEYREKQYRVMLGIDSMWKWSVDGIEGYTKSGKAPSHAAGANRSSRAGDILNNHRLSQGRAHHVRYDACDRVGWAACRKRHDYGDRPRWKNLR